MLKRLVAAVITLAVLSVSAHSAPALIPAPPQLASSAYLLVDAHTGEVIVENNSDQLLPPASLTKMMTSYIVEAELYKGTIAETDLVDISVKAWRMGGSKMFIREGTKVRVIDLLRGVIIQSGNDASVALAEHIAGSEEAFVDIMNQQAALLGMTNTTFKNATGWPAEGHLTTARDLSLLAKALINDHPKYYELNAEKYYEYNGINQPNRNKLLFRDDSVDGLKTGHTEEAGYCLVSSAERDGMRLIAVIMGTRSEEARATESQKLLAYGFRYYQTLKLYTAGDTLQTSPVWSGKSDEVSLGLQNDIYVTIPRGAQSQLVAVKSVEEVIQAPISEGQEMGTLNVKLGDEPLVDTPLVAQHAVEEAGFFARLWDGIRLFFFNLFN